MYRIVSSSARVLTATFDRAFGAQGLTANQFNLLMTVAQLGPLPVGQLARQLATDPSTLARLVTPLRREGWLRVTRGEDRRVRVLAVTDAGCDALHRALPHWHEMQRELLELFGTSRWARTRHSLSRLRRIALDHAQRETQGRASDA